jgi:putative transposase
LPERIQVDNGSEFISKALDRWPYDQQATLDFFDPANRPITRMYIESFNAIFRDQYLNCTGFYR